MYNVYIHVHVQGIPTHAHYHCGQDMQGALIVKKNPYFMPHFGGSPLGTGGLAVASDVESVN